MLNESGALERCADLIAGARSLGADQADAVYVGSHSDSVHIRLGKLETVDRSESEHFGLRVFVGQRQATIGASALDETSLEELATRAIAMARSAPEDQYAGLAPAEMLMRAVPPDLDLLSEERSPEALRRSAEEAEDAARSVDGVTNSEGAAAGTGGNVIALATSHGFAGSYAQTHHSLSAGVVAGEGSGMERGSEWRVARHFGDLPVATAIGEEAASRAIARLNPTTLPSGAMPVVFDPRVGRSLVSHMISAMAGPSIARRASFLLDHEGEQIFDSAITILDDPLKKRGLASLPFDGEGLATKPVAIVENGVLGSWLLDSASARKLGRMPTGHAVRSGGSAPSVSPSNVTLTGGTGTLADLIRDIGEGVLVTDLIGHGVNGVTGDYSRGAAGFAIKGGEIAGPVSGITIAGNLRDMYRTMRAAGDVQSRYSINVPTLRVDGMTVAGA